MTVIGTSLDELSGGLGILTEEKQPQYSDSPKDAAKWPPKYLQANVLQTVFLITFRSCDVCEVSYMHAEVSKSRIITVCFASICTQRPWTNLALQSLASWSTNPPLHSVHLAKDLSCFLDSPGQDEQPNWVKHSHTIIDQVTTFQHANPSFICLKQLYNEKPLRYNQISSTPSLPFATNAFFLFFVVVASDSALLHASPCRLPNLRPWGSIHGPWTSTA